MRLGDVLAFSGSKGARKHKAVVSSEPCEGGGFSSKTFLTADEAARYYGVSVDTVYRLMRNGSKTRNGISFKAGRATRKREKPSNFNGSEANG